MISYPEEKRNRIIVAAFSPFAYIPKDWCGGVAHYVCDSDPITYLDRKGRRECEDTIVHIKRMPGVRQSCHEFLNPIYLPHLEREISDYNELLKKYEH